MKNEDSLIVNFKSNCKDLLVKLTLIGFLASLDSICVIGGVIVFNSNNFKLMIKGHRFKRRQAPDKV